MKYTETSYLMKKRLAAALREALLQKSFAKITVSDIVDRCSVNRKTFYYHFSDIHALLYWMFSEEFQAQMQPYHTLTDYVALSCSVMDFVERNEPIFLNIAGTVGEDGIKRALYADVQSLQDQIVSDFEARYEAQFEECFRTFLVKFLTDAIIGIIMDWISKKKNRNREQTIEFLRDIYVTSVPGLIEKGNRLVAESGAEK